MTEPALVSQTSFTARSRADEVYQQLKSDLGEFQLVPGDRFTESDVAQRLGVSRTPVRQALFRLQQEGYVEVLFRSGWRVLAFNFEQFEQLYDLRMVLETSAIERLCAAVVPCLPNLGSARVSPNRQAVLLNELSAIWQLPPSQRSQDGVQVSRWDEAFHCTLVMAAGNPEMARVHREVTERIRIVRRLDFTQTARIHATYDEHSEILAAIHARQGDQAVSLLRRHIQTSQSEVHKITLQQLRLARQSQATTLSASNEKELTKNSATGNPVSA